MTDAAEDAAPLVEDEASSSEATKWLTAREKFGMSAVIHCLEPPVRVVLDSTGQHTLKWSEPLCMGSTLVPPNSLNLYTYPGKFAAPELAVIRKVLLEIAREAPTLYEQPDPVGAFVIHALCVCNTPESIAITVDLIMVQPKLLLQSHAGEPFSGETLLHIACANRREALGIRFVELGLRYFDQEVIRVWLNQQALGVFFDTPPMNFYGDSPLGYASVFGLKEMVRTLLNTGLTSLNENCGKIVGFYPLHAVSANGLRGMYDFLTTELPEEQRAQKDLPSQSGRLIHLALDDMSPLQLTCRIGLRYMHQHIMRSELVRILWVWGPVTQYQISLRGIDSSGDGACDVMEVLCRDDAAQVTREFILDEFMCGFLFNLYEQKWRKFGWYIHSVLCALDGSVVMAIIYLCINIKNETASGERQQYGACLTLTGLIFAMLAVEVWLGYLYASNYKEGVPVGELFARTWTWMEGFGIRNNIASCSCVLLAIALYFVEPGVMDGLSEHLLPAIFQPETLEDVKAQIAANSHGRRIAEVADDELMGYTHKSEAQRMKALHDFHVWGAAEARWDGIEPLMWLLLGVGFLLKFYTFLEKTVMPFTQLYVLVLSIRQVLSGDLLIFMCLFVIFIGTFVMTMITIYPDHKGVGKLPQAEEFMHPFSATHAILMAGFTGEPLDFNLHPDFLAPLGAWQKMNLVFFFLVYVLYIFLSLILLLNLLIALLGSTFSKTQEEATLHGRMAFARNVLRLERIAEFFDVNTFAGAPDGEDPDGEPRFVHNFRDVKLDAAAELPRDYKSENVFDEMPEDGKPQTPPPKEVDKGESFLKKMLSPASTSPAGVRNRPGAKPPALKIIGQALERSSQPSPFASARTPRSNASPFPSSRRAEQQPAPAATSPHAPAPASALAAAAGLDALDAENEKPSLEDAMAEDPMGPSQQSTARISPTQRAAAAARLEDAMEQDPMEESARGSARVSLTREHASESTTPNTGRSVTISVVPQEGISARASSGDLTNRRASKERWDQQSLSLASGPGGAPSAASRMAGERLARSDARSPRETVRRAASLASPLGVPLVVSGRPTTTRPAKDNYESVDATAAMIKQATPRTAAALHDKLIGGSMSPNAYANKAREAGVPHPQVATNLRHATAGSPAKRKKKPANGSSVAA